MPWSLVVIGFLLSSASFCVAYERAPNKQMDKLIGGNTEQTPMPKKRTNRPLLTSQSILFGNCTSGKKQPILPPSFTQTVNLLSVRSRMLFQIFDDGTIAANGTVQTNKNGEYMQICVYCCGRNCLKSKSKIDYQPQGR